MPVMLSVLTSLKSSKLVCGCMLAVLVTVVETRCSGRSCAWLSEMDYVAGAAQCKQLAADADDAG